MFGYVEQSFHRVAGTVKDQITLYDEKISMENVKEAAELTGLHDTIMHLPDGYDTICTPELFSQGQWQLLSIARAAAARPKLLLLDEIAKESIRKQNGYLHFTQSIRKNGKNHSD